MSFKINPFTGEPDYVGSISSNAQSATKLKITRIANEQIFSQEVVRAFSSTHVSLATGGGTLQDANVLGIADSDAATGETVDIVLLGVSSNALFSVFTINSPLFLDLDGGITDIKRTSGYHVVVGKSLGNNEILFKSENPITIA